MIWICPMEKEGKPISVLQFGTNGQLARELARAFAKDGAFHPIALSHSEVDFEKPRDVANVVRFAFDADVVINAVAYTAVDKAETDAALADCVNAHAVGELAEACRARSIPLIHVSTDYVYDGAKAFPYVESDATNPLNVYGRTKLAGEALIRACLDAHVILRTSWVFSAHGTNFVKTMRRLGTERDELRIVDDQWGAPTSAGDLAQAIVSIARAIVSCAPEHAFGTFHFSNAGETTWYRFAEEIFRLASGPSPRLTPITTAEYPTPARRPANSRLDITKIGEVFGIKPPPWQTALARVLTELKRQDI